MDLPQVPAAERGDTNVLFVMTDGHAWCMEDCPTYRQQLRDNNIITYVVGITSGFSRNVVECLVEDQADPNDPRYDPSMPSVDDYILTIPKFDKKLFYQLQLQLRATVCPPIVFKDEAFINQLYVVLTGVNVMILKNWYFIDFDIGFDSQLRNISVLSINYISEERELAERTRAKRVE